MLGFIKIVLLCNFDLSQVILKTIIHTIQVQMNKNKKTNLSSLFLK